MLPLSGFFFGFVPINFNDPTGHCEEGYMGDDYDDASCLETAQVMANEYGQSFSALAEYDWETVGIPHGGSWTGTSEADAAWGKAFVEAYRELLEAYDRHDVADVISKEFMPTEEMIIEQWRFSREELYNGRITDNIGKIAGNVFSFLGGGRPICV